MNYKKIEIVIAVMSKWGIETNDGVNDQTISEYLSGVM